MKQNIIILGITMRKYIYALLALMMAMTVSAQKLTPQEEREFYQKAYDVIVAYKNYASFGELSDQKNHKEPFKLLFENSNVSICNDLMGLDTSLIGKDSLTVYKYLQELFNGKVESVDITVSNLHKKGTIEDKGDWWQMEVVFDKAISILTKDYIYFDSKSFYGEDYHIIATIKMEKDDERQCHITGMRPSGEWPDFPKEYRILEMRETDKRDNKLFINNKEKVSFNDNFQYILRPNDKVYYNRGEVNLVPDNSVERKYHADYKDKYWRVRANMGYSLSGFNKIEGGSGLSFSDDNEMSFGIDVGYVFKSVTKLQSGVFVGIGLSKNNVTMSLPGQIKKSIKITDPNLDVDGDSYERYYKIWGTNGITQKMEATDITIPLYFDLEYQFTALYSAYADLGVRLQTSTAKSTSTIDKYETWGKYPAYNNLIIRNCDEEGKTVPNPVDINGFGPHEAQSIDVDETGTTKSIAFDALLGLGVRFNLNKSFALDAGVQYILGLSNSWKGEGEQSPIFSYDGKDKVNLLRLTDGIKHNALRLSASLIYKF